MKTSNTFLIAGLLLGTVLNALAEAPPTIPAQPTFTRITTGPGGDSDYSDNCAWADYDNDGFLDLFVVNGYLNTSTCFLYRNNGDGTFTRMTTNEVGSIVSDRGMWRDAAWGDYDNDGFLELYVTQSGGRRALYHNNGDGRFTRITTNGPLVTDISFAEAAAWGDYDGDGLLDLFVATGSSGFGWKGPNSLYHNEGGGMFSKVTTGPIPLDIPTGDVSFGGTWVDFDNDGDLDLVVGGGTNNRMFVYRNDGNGQFEAIKNGALAQDSCYMVYLSSGDYDNDGLPDLFLADWNGSCRLFHNDGNGNFTKTILTSGATEADVGCWADYDNDGYLDLFIPMGEWTGKNNLLYHNNGDGTFTPITTGSPVDDKGHWDGAAWGDYDNNGFLDLFVADSRRGGNALYRNNGNSNHWVTFKLAGTASNRAAIGAKVRVKATIGGNTFWQLRDVSGGGASQPDLRLHFGLGDATKADVVRIEWPSGSVQELTDVPTDQILTVWELPSLRASVLADGSCRLTITAEPNHAWRIESSTDLETWHTLTTITSPTPSFQYTHTGAKGLNCLFYRMLSQ